MKTRPSPRRKSGVRLSVGASLLWIAPLSEYSKKYREVLQEGGIEVTGARTLSQTNELLSSGRIFDVIVCSLRLEDAPNCEILELLSDFPPVPVIAMTDVFGGEFRDLFLKKGVIDFISEKDKDSPRYLLGFVERLLKNRETRILIVDDSLTSRNSIKQVATALNFRISTAKNGVEAMDVLQDHDDIKLVITDFDMPKMDGFMLTHKIREGASRDEIAVIGVSGNDDKFIAARFLKAGATDFIIKPFIYEELLCRIHGNVGNVELIEKIKYAANRDFLTGLLNRRHFFECAIQCFEEMEMHQGAEGGSAATGNICTAVCDIDFFKKVNDTYGHDIGDVILKHCARMLEECFGDDLVARFGGEEFVILFQRKDVNAVVDALNGFRAHLEENPPVTESGTIPFTISIGVCEVTTESLDEALKKADLGLYHAKEHGRDRVVVFDGVDETPSPAGE